MRTFFKKALPFLAIALVLSLIATSVGLYINAQQGKKTPLGWCIWEIHKHEEYDCELTYIYQEVGPKSEIEKEANKGMDIYCYYITTFAGDRIGEWFCFVECFHKDWFDWAVKNRYYSASEVNLIDCDIVRETLYE